MTRTNLFERKHLEKCYSLQEFLAGKGISIDIFSNYRIVGKLDMQPTEFLYIEYPDEIDLLIEYWIDSNNIKFYK